MTEPQFNLRGALVFIAWSVVLIFAIIVAIIRKRRSRDQTTVSPLDLTRRKKGKRCDVAQEILFFKVQETTTKFKSVMPTTDDEDESDIEEGQGSSKGPDEKHNRDYINACAICLDEFEDGETVVKSVDTKECQHMFHESCMKGVISASTRKEIVSIPCPCCRQTFVEIDEVAHA